MLAVHECKEQKEYSTLLALDAEKAFDNSQWEWLGLVLDKMEILGNFCTLLSGLYSNLTAQIHMLGFLFPPFRLSKGTRHGAHSPPYYSWIM